MSLRFNARIIISSTYLLFGVIDLVILALSGLTMFYMGVLGLLSLFLGVRLFFRNPLPLWLVMLYSVLTITTGISAIYSSIGFFGFVMEPSIILLKLGLVLYSSAASLQLIYFINKRESFIKP